MSAERSKAGLSRQAPHAIVHGVPLGYGGLGHFAATAVAALSLEGRNLVALGPGDAFRLPLIKKPSNIASIDAPKAGLPEWMVEYSWLRWRSGFVVLMRDRSIARWARQQLERLEPQSCYLFTQIALESLEWCRANHVPTTLDNPNGHIRNFHQVCEQECRRWFGKKFYGHPTEEMLRRVEREYELADRIRVHSEWAKRSMVESGVPAEKLHIARQTIDLERFQPPLTRPSLQGPLRVSFVGSLELRKGFVYLLRAMRALGPRHIQLRIVGATGERACARLFDRESAGLDVQAAPGDPRPVYQASELFVLPSLEDGLGLVALEAAACGLPVIVTDQAGAHEFIRESETGWVVPARDIDGLAGALEQALERRRELAEMGRHARADVERYAGAAQLRQVSDWFFTSAREEVFSHHERST